MEIKEILYEELEKCLDVIHKSFATVAKMFSLTKENCPKHTSFIPLYFLETQKAWGWYMYALFIEERIIGYASVSELEKGIFELHNLSVLPEYRNLGYGTMLVEHAKWYVKSNGGLKLKIGIIDESSVLKSWYISQGFKYLGNKKFDHLPFTSGYLEWEV